MSKADTTFADSPVILGSPERPLADAPNKRSTETEDDAEILGLLTAVDDNEILMALEAGAKELSSPVAGYAKMLHRDHGENLGATLMLGQKIEVTPAETATVDKLRVNAAGELAALASLNGTRFESAYIEATIKGQTEVLNLIDTQLLPRAAHGKLKKHLTETRGLVAEHLAAATQLRANP